MCTIQVINEPASKFEKTSVEYKANAITVKRIYFSINSFSSKTSWGCE